MSPIKTVGAVVLLAAAAGGALLLVRGALSPDRSAKETSRAETGEDASGGRLVDGAGAAKRDLRAPDPPGESIGDPPAAAEGTPAAGEVRYDEPPRGQRPVSPADRIAVSLRDGEEELGPADAVGMCRELLAADDLNLDHIEIACKRLGAIEGSESAELLREMWKENAAGAQKPAWEAEILGAMIQPWPSHTAVLIEVFPLLSEDRREWCLSRIGVRRPEPLRKWIVRLYRSSEDPEGQYGGLLHEAYEAYAANPPVERSRRWK